MAEKRQTRKNLKVFMKVLDADSEEVLGYLVNITTDGLMLTREGKIEPENLFRLRVILPSEVKGTTELVLAATSRWCETDEDSPDFFNIGFQVTEPTKQDIKIIKQVMKKFCF